MRTCLVMPHSADCCWYCSLLLRLNSIRTDSRTSAGRPTPSHMHAHMGTHSQSAHVISHLFNRRFFDGNNGMPASGALQPSQLFSSNHLRRPSLCQAFTTAHSAVKSAFYEIRKYGWHSVLCKKRTCIEYFRQQLTETCARHNLAYGLNGLTRKFRLIRRKTSMMMRTLRARAPLRGCVHVALYQRDCIVLRAMLTHMRMQLPVMFLLRERLAWRHKRGAGLTAAHSPRRFSL